MFSGLQGWHIIVIVVAIVLLFGAKRLPDAAKGIGHSLRIFKSEAKAMREQNDTDDTDSAAPQQQAQDPATEQLPSAGTPDTPVAAAAPPARAKTHSSTGNE
ncbi:Sec-independent protein translocase subunit TatA [Sciscionella marina]|uniref:Sec-independent protein translocase subunit TatA n=1 Tax=Sciscionella marina TaxID=508770 RepID=UPI00037CA54C|nr:Sec-independent protein translocase subunit TatA [Sciscionella marina]